MRQSYRIPIDPEPEFHNHDVRGQLRFVGPDRDESGPVVGHLEGSCVNVGRLDNWRARLSDILDCKSDDEFEAYEDLFDGDSFNESVQHMCDSLPEAVLIVNRIRIDPEHRGHKLGLTLLKTLADSTFVPSGTVIALKPFALDIDDDAEQEAMTLRLEQYWSKAGFTKPEGSLYYVRVID